MCSNLSNVASVFTKSTKLSLSISNSLSSETLSKKSVSPPKYGASAAPQKPPKFELEGKKWIVEFQRNNSGLVIRADQAEVNQSVYIYKCDGSTIQVKGKVNNIILDSCKKTAVVFGSVVSSCEFINCQSVQMQVILKSIIFTILCQLQGRKGLSGKVSLAFFDLVDCMKSFLLSEKFKL